MFSEKKIKVEITLSKDGKFWSDSEVSTYLLFNDGEGSGQSTLSESNVLTFDDFKIDVDIKKVFSAVGPTATIKIYGVSKQHMNMITTIAMKTGFITNKKVRVSVNNGNGYSTLFEGCITEAVPVYKAVPDCYIQIESSMAAFDNSQSLPPTSLGSNEAAISDICLYLCSQYGVNCIPAPSLSLIKVKPPVLNQKGLTARLAALCEAYDLSAIYTPSGYRVFKKGEGTGIVWNFTPETMQGYPTYTKQNMSIQTDTFENIEVCDLFRVDGSEIPFANGLWYINMIQYKLQARSPNGKWVATLYGTPINDGVVR